MPRNREKIQFQELFEPVSPNSKMLKASLSFENGYGCNIYKHSPNTNREYPFEFEVTHNGHRAIVKSISDDNIGYCSESDIYTLISEVKKL